MDAEISGFETVALRLRSEIFAIVKRRMARGEKLSWRSMFEIEDEAIALLRRDPDVDEASILLMLGAPSRPQHPRTDEPVRLAERNAMHTALWMILDAYSRDDGKAP